MRVDEGLRRRKIPFLGISPSWTIVNQFGAGLSMIGLANQTEGSYGSLFCWWGSRYFKRKEVIAVLALCVMAGKIKTVELPAEAPFI